MDSKTYQSTSPKKTKEIARKFSKILKGGEVIALYGELGVGKTTFTQEVARALGVNKRIPSPTFIIMRSYKTPKLRGKVLYHVDLYRVKSISDLNSVDIKEIINNPNNITFIEWAEKAKKLLPKKRMEIYIVYKGKDSREIRIETKQ